MLKIWSFALATLLLSACDSKIEDLKSEKKSSNIPVTETDGVVSGTVSASATSDQMLVASASSDLADASVTFPPGSLSASTDIALGVAADQSTAILGELGITDAVQASTPMYVGPSSGTVPGVLQPLTISLPLPIDEVSGLRLLEKEVSKLILIYAIYNDGWKAGVIPLTVENLLGTFTNVPLKGLGYFQIVYVNTSRSAKEVASVVVPHLEDIKK